MAMYVVIVAVFSEVHSFIFVVHAMQSEQRTQLLNTRH